MHTKHEASPDLKTTESGSFPDTTDLHVGNRPPNQWNPCNPRLTKAWTSASPRIARIPRIGIGTARERCQRDAGDWVRLIGEATSETREKKRAMHGHGVSGQAVSKLPLGEVGVLRGPPARPVLFRGFRAFRGFLFPSSRRWQVLGSAVLGSLCSLVDQLPCFLLLSSVVCFAVPLASLAAAPAVITSNLTISETDTTYDGADLVINGPVTVTINGSHAFRSLLLSNQAVVTHSPCTASETHKLELTVADAITVSADSRIDASRKGYLPNRKSVV